MSGIMTITGNSGGAVGPNSGGNINLVGSGLISVAGNSASNTLTISLTGSGSNKVTTTDDTPTPIITIAVPDGRTVIVDAIIAATSSTGDDSLGGTVTVTVLRSTGGDVALVGVPNINSNTTSTADLQATADVGSESVIIYVIGVAAETWNWSATYNSILV